MKKTERKNTHTSSFLDTKRKVVIACIASAVVLLLVFILMLTENKESQLTIKNKTDLNLEYVKAYYVYSEGKVNDGIEAKEIKPEDTLKFALDPMNFLYAESNLEVVFKFENYDELFVDAGYFHDNFTGSIAITFNKTDDPEVVKLKVKGNNGIISSSNIKCNENYTVNLRDGYIPD